MHRLDIEKPLAGKGALAKKVLINLRGRRAVGVDAALPGKKPVVIGEIAGLRQRRDHARLQNSIAARDLTAANV